jgi:hypothetical protein
VVVSRAPSRLARANLPQMLVRINPGSDRMANIAWRSLRDLAWSRIRATHNQFGSESDWPRKGSAGLVT